MTIIPLPLISVLAPEENLEFFCVCAYLNQKEFCMFSHVECSRESEVNILLLYQ